MTEPTSAESADAQDANGGTAEGSNPDPGTGRDPLSIAALTVIALAIAIFLTLGIIKVFGTEKSDAVDVTDALNTTAEDQASTPFEVGEPVPDADLEMLGGGTTSISDLLGKPLVVNFWSSTCAPCLAEMPDFESVHQELDGQVGFLGVDVTDTAEAGQKMVEQTGVTYPNGRDPRAEVMSSFGGIALPRTVLIDADGNVAAVHSGAMTADELKDSLSKSNLL